MIRWNTDARLDTLRTNNRPQAMTHVPKPTSHARFVRARVWVRGAVTDCIQRQYARIYTFWASHQQQAMTHVSKPTSHAKIWCIRLCVCELVMEHTGQHGHTPLQCGQQGRALPDDVHHLRVHGCGGAVKGSGRIRDRRQVGRGGLHGELGPSLAPRHLHRRRDTEVHPTRRKNKDGRGSCAKTCLRCAARV